MAAAADIELAERGELSESRISSSSDSESDSGYEVIEDFESMDAEKALQQFKAIVERQNRQLSMSREERDRFKEVAERCFAELNITLRRSQCHRRPVATRSVSADGNPNYRQSDEPEDEGTQQDGAKQNPNSEEHAVYSGDDILDENSPGCNSHNSDAASGFSSPRSSSHTSAEGFGRRPRRYSSISDVQTENGAIITEVFNGYMDEPEDYLNSLTLPDLVQKFSALMMYYLNDLQSCNPGSGEHEATNESIQLLKTITEANVVPSMYYKALNDIFQQDPLMYFGQLNSSSLGQSSNSLVTYRMIRNFLSAIKEKTPNDLLPSITFCVDSECRICLLENVVMLRRNCCPSSACYNCYKDWVKTCVFNRSVEVGCPWCDCYLTKDEIVELLEENRSRYYELLTDKNCDKNKKTCPHCNMVTTVPRNKNKKRKGGRQVTCTRCEFTWCFTCHGPMHPNVSCRSNQTGLRLLTTWGKTVQSEGDQVVRKARKCPSCKAWIEKNQGCQHMTCLNCKYEFCYLCGKNWRGGNMLFGKHSSRWSIFGCKQKFLPDRPVARKLTRGTLFVLEVLGLLIGAPVTVGLLIALSPILGAIGIGVLIYKCKR